MSNISRLPTTSSLFTLADELDRFFPSTMRRALSRADLGSDLADAEWAPAVDVKEDAHAYTVTADIPGVDPKAIKVEFQDGMLTISGERKEEKKDSSNGYRRIERFEGSFLRRFTVPDAADADKVTAKSDKGVLTVTIPKAPIRKARQIAVA